MLETSTSLFDRLGQSRWTVRRQISVSLVLLLAIMATLVVTANLMLRSVQGSVATQSERATPALILILNIDRDSYQAQIALERIVAGNDGVDLAAEVAAVEENTGQTVSRYEAFEGVSIALEGEAALTEQLVPLHTQWLADVNATLAAPVEQRPQQLATATASFAVYREALDQVGGLYEEEITRLTDEIGDGQRNTVLANWIALALAIVAGGVIVRFVSRRIGNAIVSRSGSVQNASTSLGSLASGITSRATATAERAESARHSADEVASTVSEVTVAVEELSACIAEIAQQTELANNVAVDAVAVADDAHRIIEQLGQSSQEIDDVVKTIRSIAEQTNMLALNATIEAARAGAAGRGFNVVATEVKELAGETARATQEITGRIAAIQRDTEAAINANRAVNEIIVRISEMQQSIAAAVEEQSITTSQIAAGATVAAESSRHISAAVADVASQAAETKSAGEDAGRSADELTRLAVELDGLVTQPA